MYRMTYRPTTPRPCTAICCPAARLSPDCRQADRQAGRREVQQQVWETGRPECTREDHCPAATICQQDATSCGWIDALTATSVFEKTEEGFDPT